MGICCVNEAKRVDAKEANLHGQNDPYILERAVKSQYANFSLEDQEIVFEMEVKNLCSPNNQINVFYISYIGNVS